MTKAERWNTLAAEFGHEILAQNDEGYVARDPVFPHKLARLVGCKEGDDRPGGRLPMDCIDAPSLRKWAATLNAAADALERPITSLMEPLNP